MTSPVPPPKETYQNGLRTLAEVHSGLWKSGPIPCMNLLGAHFPLHEFVGGTFSLAWICWGNIFPCMNLLEEHFPLPEFFLPTPTITLIMVRPKSKEISRPTLRTGSSRRWSLEKISLSVSPSLNLNCRYFYAVDSDPKDPNQVTWRTESVFWNGLQ